MVSFSSRAMKRALIQASRTLFEWLAKCVGRLHNFVCIHPKLLQLSYQFGIHILFHHRLSKFAVQKHP